MQNNIKHLDEPALNYARKDYSIIDHSLTVGEALDHILREGVGEKIVYFYVVDTERHLVGVIPTRRLLTTPGDRFLVDIMISRLVKLPKSATVYDACEYFVMYRFLAFPIVDEENHIIGIIDVNVFTDEIINMESSREELNTVFETIGFRISEVSNASPVRVFRFRFPWLLATISSGTICAVIAGLFSATLEQSMVIAFFLTMLLGLGESVSIQSMTVALQLLEAVGPSLRWYMVQFRREIYSASLLGLGCSSAVMLIASVWLGFTPDVMSIGLSILLAILVACIIGLSVPSLIHALALDPRIASLLL
jgi:magnesium transporter